MFSWGRGRATVLVVESKGCDDSFCEAGLGECDSTAFGADINAKVTLSGALSSEGDVFVLHVLQEGIECCCSFRVNEEVVDVNDDNKVFVDEEAGVKGGLADYIRCGASRFFQHLVVGFSRMS
jgi:hypothetical protein